MTKFVLSYWNIPWFPKYIHHLYATLQLSTNQHCKTTISTVQHLPEYKKKNTKHWHHQPLVFIIIIFFSCAVQLCCDSGGHKLISTWPSTEPNTVTISKCDFCSAQTNNNKIRLASATVTVWWLQKDRVKWVLLGTFQLDHRNNLFFKVSYERILLFLTNNILFCCDKLIIKLVQSWVHLTYATAIKVTLKALLSNTICVTLFLTRISLHKGSQPTKCGDVTKLD